MKLNRRKLKLFALGFLAFLHTAARIYAISSSNVAMTIIQYFQYVDYLLLLGGLEAKGYKAKELGIYALLGVVGAVLTFTSGEALFLCAILAIIVSKKESYEEICKVLLKGTTFAFVLSVLLYILGISNSGVSRRDAIALGFGHPNVCGSVIATMIFLYFSLSEKKYRKRQWAVLIAGILANLFILSSRTTAVLLVLLPIIRWLLPKILKKQNRVIKAIICLLPILIFTVVMYITINFDYTNPIYYRLSQLFSGRPILNHYNYQQFGFMWLGRKIEIDYTALQGHNTIDCSFLSVLLQCGIIGTVVFLLGYMFTLYKSIRKKKYSILAVTILILLAGIMENSALEIVSGFPLIYLADLDGTYEFGRRRRKKNDS